MGIASVRIWSVTWRNGRPRFNPGPKLRALKFAGEDLRHPDGTWYSLDQAIAWAQATKAEAERRRGQRSAGKRMIVTGFISPGRRAGPTIEGLFEDFGRSPKFTGGLAQGKRQEKGLSEKTIRDYRAKWRLLCRFDPELAASHPAAVTDKLAQQIYERLWEQKGLYMARGLVAVASSCWRWAVKRGQGGVTHNPWRAVEKQVPAPRTVVLEDFEIAAWVAACDAPDADGVVRPELGDAILLGLFTGQRQGDRLKLQHAGRDDRGRLLFKQGKTGMIVAIPATPQLEARLAAAAARRKALGLVDPHVVLDERRCRPFQSDHYGHLVAERRALAVSGLRVPDEPRNIVPSPHSPAQTGVNALMVGEGQGGGWLLKPCPTLAGKRDQDLRDTAVTWLARAGATPFEIAAITGHSFVSIHNILRHYLALHPEMADAAIGKLVDWMKQQGKVV